MRSEGRCGEGEGYGNTKVVLETETKGFAPLGKREDMVLFPGTEFGARMDGFLTCLLPWLDHGWHWLNGGPRRFFIAQKTLLSLSCNDARPPLVPVTSRNTPSENGALFVPSCDAVNGLGEGVGGSRDRVEACLLPGRGTNVGDHVIDVGMYGVPRRGSSAEVCVVRRECRGGGR